MDMVDIPPGSDSEFAMEMAIEIVSFAIKHSDFP